MWFIGCFVFKDVIGNGMYHRQYGIGLDANLAMSSFKQEKNDVANKYQEYHTWESPRMEILPQNGKLKQETMINQIKVVASKPIMASTEMIRNQQHKKLKWIHAIGPAKKHKEIDKC